MFTLPDDVPERGELRGDICIIGAGAAGISIALQLAGSGARIVLLEGGGLADDARNRGIYKVAYPSTPALTIHPPLRWRFGGNTNNWVGNCRPLDENDFLPRSWIPYSGWPFPRSHLVPFYERALALCGLGDLSGFDPDAWQAVRQPPLRVAPETVCPKVVQTCPILSFDDLYRKSLEHADGVQVCLHSQVLRLRTTGQGDRVTAVEAASVDGRRFQVVARMFVLAAGGVENPRLLLASDEVNPNGLANDHDLVGRFFMEHPYVDVPLGRTRASGQLLPRQRAPSGGRVWEQMALSPELMQHRQVAGMNLWSCNPIPLRDFARARAEALLRKPIPELMDLGRDAGAIIRDAWGRLATTARYQAERERSGLRISLEQIPDPENRVRLSPQRDALGRRWAHLDFRLTDQGRRRDDALRMAADALGLDGPSVARAARLMLRVGRVGFFWHHMGTTRMDPDPQRGVVDADCRVHGVENLFIAGSSVFPTGGTAPPTLTIVALALRLADHLAGELG